MNGTRSIFGLYRIPILILIGGIGLSLLLLRFSLARQPAQENGGLGNPALVDTGRQSLAGLGVDTPTPTASPPAILAAQVTPDQNCTYTYTYWNDHPERWPVENIVVGEYSFNKPEVEKVFQSGDQDLPTVVLKEFIAAVLNSLKGADTGAINEDLITVGRWIEDHPQQIDLIPTERRQGEILVNLLRAYNNGLSGPGLCSDQPLTPTPTLTATPTATPTLRPGESTPTETGTPEQNSGGGDTSSGSGSNSTPDAVETKAPATSLPSTSPPVEPPPATSPPSSPPDPPPTSPPSNPPDPPPTSAPPPPPTEAPPPTDESPPAETQEPPPPSDGDVGNGENQGNQDQDKGKDKDKDKDHGKGKGKGRGKKP